MTTRSVVRLSTVTGHVCPVAVATGHGLAAWEKYGHPPTTPLDIRLGLTSEEGVNFPLRWGIVSASAIASDWIKSLQDVPGATLQAVWARDHEKGRKYAEQHGIHVAHATFGELCRDPEVDIVYIASKTFDHHWQALEVLKAGKAVLVEKPFMDTAEQAREVYDAADKAGVACFEGMWTRFFPAYEHARAALDAGVIGKVLSVQSDYTDMVYALTAAPFALGRGKAAPVVRAVGAKPTVQRSGHGKGLFSGGGGSNFVAGARTVNPAAVSLQYSELRAVASITVAAGRFVERTEIVGTKGRITMEPPAHHPTALTIRAAFPKRLGSRKPALAFGENGFEGDWEDFVLRKHGDNPSAGPFGYVERFDYPLPTPAPRARGEPAGSRWTGERMVHYKGWNWSGGNQHGFMYQAQAVHRCMAAGLREFPQFTRAESLHVSQIIDQINQQCAEVGF